MRFNMPKQDSTSAPEGGRRYIHKQRRTWRGEECLRPMHSRRKYTPNLPVPSDNLFVCNLIYSLASRFIAWISS